MWPVNKVFSQMGQNFILITYFFCRWWTGVPNTKQQTIIIETENKCVERKNLPVPRNRRNGFTMATNRSSDMATNVNTDTPVEKSFINSDIIHTPVPQGQLSTVYTTDTNGTAVNISIKSAIDSDKMCLNEYRKYTHKKLPYFQI